MIELFERRFRLLQRLQADRQVLFRPVDAIEHRLLMRIGNLLEAAPGGTRLTNDVALDPSPGVLGLAARLSIPRVKAAVAENLSKLKEIPEARNQQGGA